MTVKNVVEGSYAIAKAVQLCRPKVMAVYPITPQTHIPEDLAQMAADGEFDAEIIRVESEHSAISACVGASATGVRTCTSTSSQGLALMHEILFIAAGMRLPIVMTVANRALSAPINIWCFSKDAMVLTADLTYKSISSVKAGDMIIGKDDKGNLRFTEVKRTFRRCASDTVKVKTAKFDLICTPEHEFYYHSGHRHWVCATNLKNKKLHWFGYGFEENDAFKRGWLAGMADGDGCFFMDECNRHSFKLNVKDEEIVKTFIKWSNGFGFSVRETECNKKRGFYTAILTRNSETTRLRNFLLKNGNPGFCRGYLAGIYDAEGSGPYKVKQAVIYNSDKRIINYVSEILKKLEISFKVYSDRRRGGYYKRDNYHVKINNVPEFFIKCRPVLQRKRKNILRMTLKSVKSRIEVLDVARMRKKTEVYNLETGTNNYIVNGLLVHNCDQQDSIAERDSGWIQLYCENAQEAFDTHIQAFRIAEESGLPVMVCVDGFQVTHTYEPVEFISEEKVKKFLPDYKPRLFLNPSKPMTQGPLATPAYYMEFRQELHMAVKTSTSSIMAANREYHAVSGRIYGNGLLENVNMKGKKCALLTFGSVAGTARAVLEKHGVGMIRLRCFRPFPSEELLRALDGVECLGVLEKDISLGANGALYDEVMSMLHAAGSKVKVSSFIAGLGGRDVTLGHMESVMEKIKSGKEVKEWLM